MIRRKPSIWKQPKCVPALHFTRACMRKRACMRVVLRLPRMHAAGTSLLTHCTGRLHCMCAYCPPVSHVSEYQSRRREACASAPRASEQHRPASGKTKAETHIQIKRSSCYYSIKSERTGSLHPCLYLYTYMDGWMDERERERERERESICNCIENRICKYVHTSTLLAGSWTTRTRTERRPGQKSPGGN